MPLVLAEASVCDRDEKRDEGMIDGGKKRRKPRLQSMRASFDSAKIHTPASAFGISAKTQGPHLWLLRLHLDTYPTDQAPSMEMTSTNALLSMTTLTIPSDLL